MTTAVVIHAMIGLTVLLFFGEFARESFVERKPRALLINLTAMILVLSVWIATPVLFDSYWLLSVSPSVVALALAVLFFFPIKSRHPLDLGKAKERFDERDIMFAREEYMPGTEKYQRYYDRHPEYKNVDDRIRALPELLAPGGEFYDPLRSGQIEAFFRMIEELSGEVDGPVAEEVKPIEASEATAFVKRLLINLGADEVGVARLDSNHVYSHVGRGPELWGEPIVNDHKYVIVFTLEMDYHQVEKSPLLNITEETARGYLNGSLLSTSLAAAIRGIGYPARAHVAGSNYQVIMPAVAHDAGLGELGRFGYLISKKHGARIRLGAVTTDLPLIPDKPVRFGVHEFCRICKKCADNCPSRAIPFDDPVEIRGITKWPLNMERCITYWRLAGTDCGLCMKVCPFSHPPMIVHKIIRAGIDRSAAARRISMIGDDLYYGRIVREFILKRPPLSS